MWESACDAPPFQSVATDCMVMDCLCFLRRPKVESEPPFPRRILFSYQTSFQTASLKITSHLRPAGEL